jgi:uncharacterized protein YbjT (DUF2867 family)
MTRVLLTGATGYVGGRLLPLLAASYQLRCLARRPEALASRAPRGVEVVAGDLLEPESLRAAMSGVDAAIYLVHSLGEGSDFEDAERRSAQNFSAAAAAAGVSRILYLGGLAAERADLSPHLRSRHEVGDILRASGVPVVELRASIIIGSGSLSFEMVRALVERLPVMITPRWVETRSQPVALDDALRALSGVLGREETIGEVYELGGPAPLTYREMMMTVGRLVGRRPLIIPAPLLSPRLSSHWLRLVTDVDLTTARALVDSLTNEVVVHDHRIEDLLGYRPMKFAAAARRALAVRADRLRARAGERALA